MLKNLHIKDYDFKLIFFLILLNTIGIFAVKSANPASYSKQFLGFILGLCIMVVISFFDYKVLLKFYWLSYIVTIALLVAVRVAGSSANNAVRWFTIFGIRFQPSELSKILLIIFFAQFIMKYKDRINTVRFLFSFILLAVIPMFLIFEQPDLSTTIVVFIILASIIFIAGLSWKIILGLFVVAVPSAIIFLSVILKEGQTLINDYQRRRILSFFYPEKFVDDAYQQTNSVIAIGSGGLVGKGFNNDMISSLKNGNFIIEPETDFIFAVIGEELGFIGTVTVIVLLFLIVLECLLIARRATDISGRVIATGMAAWIGFQSFFNIGVTTFLLPNTGLTLPFVSYGLTSLLSLYIGMGFVLNVRFRSASGRERGEGATKLEDYNI